jgi:CRP/FNR family cyclic AMP-dependent transcriptional regulator
MNISQHCSLRDVAIFRDLSGSTIGTLEARCTWRAYERGEQIVGHLEATQDVFFITTGLARVTIYSADGKAVAFRDLHPGDLFGEFSAIDEEPRSATIEALQSSVTASLSPADFRNILAAESEVAMALVRHLVTQARALTSRIYAFSALAVQNRIHGELLRLAYEIGCKSGAVRLVPSPTHALIAARISTHREAVSRELSRLANIGVLRREGTTLCIADVERLALMVEQAINE